MKRLFSVLVLALLAFSTLPAQDINFSSSVVVYPIPFTQSELDTLTTTDSSLVIFRAPFNMQVRNFQAITPVLADTGAAGSAGVVKLWKRDSLLTAPTEMATATVLEVNANYTGTPSTTALARIAQGDYLQLGAILSTSDKIAGLTVLIWYTRY